MTIKRVVIFGVGGFIGFNLFSYLNNLNLDCEVIGLSRVTKNLNSQFRLKKLIRDHTHKIILYNNKEEVFETLRNINPVTLVNCAGILGNESNLTNFFEANCMFPLELITKGRFDNFKKFIHFSTIDTSTIKHKIESKENFYALSKFIGEKIVVNACQHVGVNFSIIKPSTTFGRYMNNDRLIARVFECAKNGKSLILDSNSTKSFVFADNISKLVLADLFEHKSQIHQICGDRELHLTELVEIIQKKLGLKIKYKILNETPEHLQKNNVQSCTYEFKDNITNKKPMVIDKKVPLETAISEVYYSGQYSVR